MIGGWVGPQAGFTRLQLSPERYPDTVAECGDWRLHDCLGVWLRYIAFTESRRSERRLITHQNQKRPHCTHTPDNL